MTLARTRFSLYSTLANAFASLTFTDAPRGEPAATVLPRARGGTPAPARENVDTLFFPLVAAPPDYDDDDDDDVHDSVQGRAIDEDEEDDDGRSRALRYSDISCPSGRVRHGASSTDTLGRTVTSSPTAS